MKGNTESAFKVYVRVYDDKSLICERNITEILDGGTVIIPIKIEPERLIYRLRIDYQSTMVSENYYEFEILYVALIT